MEARTLMLSSNNVLSPANGEPIIVPSQDIVLGLYYMTREKVGARGEGMAFIDVSEALRAYESRQVELGAAYRVRIRETDRDEHGNLTEKLTRHETTVGRALLSEILPAGLPFPLINKALKKKEDFQLINASFRRCGLARDGDIRRQAHVHRFHLSARAPAYRSQSTTCRSRRRSTRSSAMPRRKVQEIESQYTSGLVTQGERYNKVVDIWGAPATWWPRHDGPPGHRAGHGVGSQEC
jgi:DNA-directed RNA polymerase subunit beta'